MKRVEPLAIVSLDRRLLDGDDGWEQWRHYGVRVVRDLVPEFNHSAGDITSLVGEAWVPGLRGTRFVLLGRWWHSRDYWTGECDGWFEDLELVPISGRTD